MFTTIYNHFITKKIVKNNKQHIQVNSYLSTWDSDNIYCVYCLNNEMHPIKEYIIKGKTRGKFEHKTKNQIHAENELDIE